MRKKVEFIKAHVLNGVLCVVGTKAQMRSATADQLIEQNIIREYTGRWPPKKGKEHKTKFNLKDLK
jgi:hypothetical protein